VIEVGRQEPAGIVLDERIDPDHVTALEVIEHHLVADRDERLIRTFAALDPWLLADAPHPLVGTGGRVSLASRARVDPEPWEHVVTATEETAEEADLLRSRAGR
jgi:hypothetical protein